MTAKPNDNHSRPFSYKLALNVFGMIVGLVIGYQGVLMLADYLATKNYSRTERTAFRQWRESHLYVPPEERHPYEPMTPVHRDKINRYFDDAHYAMSTMLNDLPLVSNRAAVLTKMFDGTPLSSEEMDILTTRVASWEPVITQGRELLVKTGEDYTFNSRAYDTPNDPHIVVQGFLFHALGRFYQQQYASTIEGLDILCRLHRMDKITPGDRRFTISIIARSVAQIARRMADLDGHLKEKQAMLALMNRHRATLLGTGAEYEFWDEPLFVWRQMVHDGYMSASFDAVRPVDILHATIREGEYMEWLLKRSDLPQARREAVRRRLDYFKTRSATPFEMPIYSYQKAIRAPLIASLTYSINVFDYGTHTYSSVLSNRDARATSAIEYDWARLRLALQILWLRMQPTPIES